MISDVAYGTYAYMWTVDGIYWALIMFILNAETPYGPFYFICKLSWFDISFGFLAITQLYYL